MSRPSPFIQTVRTELRTRHYALKTEKTYLYWVRHFIRFHDKRHPEMMGNAEIERFLNYLANTRQVSAATQNQALCALIFMYRYVIKRDIEGLNYSFAKRPKNMPTVLSPREVAGIRRIKHILPKSDIYCTAVVEPFPTDSSLFRRQPTPDAPVFNLFKPNSRTQPNSQPAASSKGAAKHDQDVIESVEQPGLWRRTALRQYHRIGRECFAIQVGQDSLDNRRVFNTSNDLDLPLTALAGLDIDVTVSLFP